MPELYLALSKHEAKVGSTVTVQVSGLLPPLPYEIWINNDMWVRHSNYSGAIQHHDYHANEIGIYDFYALMYYPLGTPTIIYSNHESLAVLTYEPDGNGNNNNGNNHNGEQNIGIIIALLFFILIIAALGRQR